MSEKHKKEIPDLNSLTREEKMKYEIAEELGLLDRVLEDGWKTLSAKETGRIGGLVTRRKREEKRALANSNRYRNLPHDSQLSKKKKHGPSL